MLHFQKLDVYQRSIEFLAVANRIRGLLPKGNADLADQLRRAAQSIPQNIAEGCGRTTRADKAKHYTIARGSAMECAAHLDVMKLDEAGRKRAVRARHRLALARRRQAH
jgi:four helix bundle protein